MARAAFIFDVPPISQIDPGGNFIGSSSVWATAQGTNTPAIPNAAEPLSQPTLKNPDLYLAERDNQVAAYVARVTQALKNPFAYASRIYVQIDASGGGDAQESETYVLTDNLFISGNTYTAGEQVLYGGAWYLAINTTTDTPPSSNWSAIDFPTQRQFLADPSLDSRNRIVYDTAAQTLQWFRETLDLVHIPQIVGFYVPGIFPDQTIHTVAAVPERKDAQFYRQKSSRVEFSTGTYSSQQVFNPTGNNDPSSTYVVGGLNTLFQSTKYATLTIPDNFTVNFENLICYPGTYALDCLVRPCPEIAIAGGDNQQGFADSDGGTTYSGIGDVRNWELALPAGSWTLFVDFSNASASPSSSFGIKISQGAVSILANTLPLYYTDSNGNPLPQGSIISSPGIALQSAGQVYNFNVQWTSGAGQFHITRLRFVQTNGPDTSHYIMQAKWLNADGPGVPSVSNLNVIGQADMPDAMPFRFYMAGTDLAPAITLAWLPNSAAAWQAVAYAIGDQVLYNLIYWQATTATKPTDVPGQSPFWTQIGQEPQIPLLFEQIQLSKLVETIPTPEVVGFQGFRQDMLERALRADQDAYTKALSQVGTNFPEFRDSDNSWTLASTGSWMTFIETYQPRLRQAGTVASGDIVQDRQYEVITQTGESITYNGITYSNGQKFYGIQDITTYDSVGQPIVSQVGAYRPSQPADIGKAGLVPAGVEYIRLAGTGTVYGWYPSYASYPTHQAILPWMIEQGFYVADDDFQSPDGNVSPPGSPDNPPIPHPPVSLFIFVPQDSVDFSVSLLWIASALGNVYGSDAGSNFYSSPDAKNWTLLNVVNNFPDTTGGFIYADSQFVAVGYGGFIYTSTDAITWNPQSSPASGDLLAITYGGGKFVAVGNDSVTVNSTNGVSWSQHFATAGTMRSVAYGAGTFVAVGDGGQISTSTDGGNTWNSQSSGTSNQLASVIYGGGQFIAVGAGGTILVSTNGTLWTPRTGDSNDLACVLYYNGSYFTTSQVETIYVSSDTINWTPVVTEPLEHVVWQIIGFGSFIVGRQLTFD